MERAIHGTPEADYKDGLTSRIGKVSDTQDRMFRWLNRWGFAIIGAFLGFGILNGAAAKTIGKILAGFVGG